MWKTHENEIVNPNTSQYYHKWLVSRGAIWHCSSRTGILSSVECEVVTHSGPRRAGILLLRKWVWRVSGSCHDKHTQTEPWPGFMSLIHFQPPLKITIHISILWILISQISRQNGWFGSWGPFFYIAQSDGCLFEMDDGWWNWQNCQAGWWNLSVSTLDSLDSGHLWDHWNYGIEIHISTWYCVGAQWTVMLLGMSMDWLKEHVTANLAFNPKWLGVSCAFLQIFHPIQIRSLGSNRQLALPSVARFLRANSQAGQRGILVIPINGLVWKWGSQKSIG